MGFAQALGAGLSGVTQGLENRQKKKDAEESRKLRQADAQRRSEEGEMRLAQLGMKTQQMELSQPVEMQRLQMQSEQQDFQIKQFRSKAAKQESLEAFKQYMNSEDVGSLSYFFQQNKDNPEVRSMFQDTVNVDQLNLESQDDRNRILAMGISEEDLDGYDGTADGNIDWPKLKMRFIVTTDSQGEKKVIDITSFLGASGYTEWDRSNATKQKIADLADLKGKTLIAKEQQLTEESAARTKGIQDGTYGKKSSGGSASELSGSRYLKQDAAAKVAQAKRDGIDLDYDEVLEDLGVVASAKRSGGIKAAQIEKASQAGEQWKKLGFEQMSQDELRGSATATKLVETIEAVNPFSTAENKVIRSIKSMAVLAAEAGQLSSTQTGIWDKAMSSLGSLVFKGAEDKEAKTAYGNFRNKFRHALFGATLTKGEATAFNEANGYLGQRIGPVLTGLRSPLLTIQSDLKSISDMKRPEVIQMRMGMTRGQIDDAIKGLEERIDYYTLVSDEGGGLTPDEAWDKVKGTTGGIPAEGNDLDNPEFKRSNASPDSNQASAPPEFQRSSADSMSKADAAAFLFGD